MIRIERGENFEENFSTKKQTKKKRTWFSFKNEN